jgi:serine/threonine protein phosphatase PrpC
MITELIDKRKHQKNSTKVMEDLLDNLLAKSTLEELGCDNMTAVLIKCIQ